MLIFQSLYKMYLSGLRVSASVNQAKSTPRACSLSGIMSKCIRKFNLIRTYFLKIENRRRKNPFYFVNTRIRRQIARMISTQVCDIRNIW